jgi:hypothetical protein
VVCPQVFLFAGKFDLELLQESRDFVLGVVDGIEDFEDWVQDELVECAFKLLTPILGVLRPLLCLGVEEVVTLDQPLSAMS